MFRRLMAVLLLTAPTAAAMGQTEDQVREQPGQNGQMGAWGLAQMPNGCMLQATSPQGTMLSIWAFAGEQKLGFLLQNRGWNNLRDGQHYKLNLSFTGGGSLPVEATARREIDSDGPGFFFAIEPGARAGDGFLDGFSSAKGMEIRRDGQRVDTLPIGGGRDAMAALAHCLSDRWAEAPDMDGEAATAEPASAETQLRL
ncbi:MAG TPA: hypothetical protein VGB62_09275 [Allosphingosinicella sp.]|jgi:hypothetical protein